MDNKICDRHAYGQHIDLTCRNHPSLVWTTKNIDYIGARSVFYDPLFGEGDRVRPNHGKMGPECPCTIVDLVHRCCVKCGTDIGAGGDAR